MFLLFSAVLLLSQEYCDFGLEGDEKIDLFWFIYPIDGKFICKIIVLVCSSDNNQGRGTMHEMKSENYARRTRDYLAK